MGPLESPTPEDPLAVVGVEGEDSDEHPCIFKHRVLWKNFAQILHGVGLQALVKADLQDAHLVFVSNEFLC